jgi:hypothetical protein
MQIVQISGAKTQPVVQRADGEHVRNDGGWVCYWSMSSRIRRIRSKRNILEKRETWVILPIQMPVIVGRTGRRRRRVIESYCGSVVVELSSESSMSPLRKGSVYSRNGSVSTAPYFRRCFQKRCRTSKLHAPSSKLQAPRSLPANSHAGPGHSIGPCPLEFPRVEQPPASSLLRPSLGVRISVNHSPNCDSC